VAHEKLLELLPLLLSLPITLLNLILLLVVKFNVQITFL